MYFLGKVAIFAEKPVRMLARSMSLQACSAWGNPIIFVRFVMSQLAFLAGQANILGERSWPAEILSRY
jgi:hypothetical protein